MINPESFLWEKIFQTTGFSKKGSDNLSNTSTVHLLYNINNFLMDSNHLSYIQSTFFKKKKKKRKEKKKVSACSQ